jgi:hypothetical protein
MLLNRHSPLGRSSNYEREEKQGNGGGGVPPVIR